MPRLKEIINVATTIKTPSLRIMLTEELRKSQEATREVGNAIEYTNMSQVVASSALYYDPDPERTIIKADQALVEFYNDTLEDERQDGVSKSPWIIRFEIENSKLDGKGLTLKMIEDKIRSAMVDTPIDIVRSFDTQMVKKHVLRIRPPDLEDDEGSVPIFLKEIEDVLLNQLALKGIDKITKVSYSNKTAASSIIMYDENGKQTHSKDNWIIETDGVALKQVMAVENVEYGEVMSNDIQEILATLGIEAARAGLLEELNMILGSYGVNHRHLATLVDIMTTRGKLMSITRHGINRVDDAGALRKCSFEETVEILLEASFHAEVDPLAGVTENIIMGQLAPYGTGAFEVMMDCSLLQQNTQNNSWTPGDRSQRESTLNGGDTLQLMPTPIQLIKDENEGYMTARSAYDVNAFTPGPAQTPNHAPDSSYLYNSAIGGQSPILGQSNDNGLCGSPLPTIDNSGTAQQYSHNKGQGTTGNVTSSGPYGLYSGANQAPMSPFHGGGVMQYSPLPGGASPRGVFGSNAVSSPILNPTSVMGSGMQTPIAGANTRSFQYMYTGSGPVVGSQMPGSTNANNGQ